MTKLFLVRTGGGDIIGWGPNDQAYLGRLAEGECIECDTYKARNPQHHKLFFSLLNDAFENQEQYPNRTALLIALKLRCGWFEEHITADGKLVYIPKSISFARMGQEEFEDFYGDAVKALAEMFPDNRSIVEEADETIARR